MEIIKELNETLSIMTSRIYLYGESNGGFLGYELAVKHSDVFAAFVSHSGSVQIGFFDDFKEE